MIWPFSSATADELVAEALTADYAQVIAEIHARTFKPAWTDGEFIGLLQNDNTGGVLLRLPHDRGGIVVGFALIRMAVQEAEVLTIAVDPKWQNRGFGRRLLDIIIANLGVDGIKSLFLEVDEANASAVALYRRCGFEQVAIRKNYYSVDDDEKSNALVMRHDVK